MGTIFKGMNTRKDLNTVLKDRSSKRERERIVYLKRPWGHVNCGDEHSQATFDQGKVTGTTSVQTR